MEKYLNEEYCDQDIGGYVWKVVIKYFGNDWGVTDRGATVVHGYIFIRILTPNQTV